MTDPADTLSAADEARTPGPWMCTGLRYDSLIVDAIVSVPRDSQGLCLTLRSPDTTLRSADATFIALCGTHVTAILARIRAAEAERDDYRKALTSADTRLRGNADHVLLVRKILTDVLVKWREIRG